MFNKDDYVGKTDYTYSDLTKPHNRDFMSKVGVSRLGTQSGGFGKFTPHFTVLSNQATANIRSDAIQFCNESGLSKDDFLSSFPSLVHVIT